MQQSNIESNLYPLPHKVCAYGTKEEFERYSNFSATDSGQWVHWEDRTELALQGRYTEIFPLLVEFLTTLNCSFRCPTCSRRKLREKWAGVNTWTHQIDTSKTLMPLESMQRALDIFVRYNIPGIIWGGGDPTLNPDTYKAMRYAKHKGLQSSFLTNGYLLTQSTIDTLLDIEPQLIRISLNCGSEEVHRIFHGYSSSDRYFNRVIENIAYICKTRQILKSNIIFGISVIIDERNLDDTLTIAKLMRDISNKTGHKAIDFALFRPVYDYYDYHADINPSTYDKISSLLDLGGKVRELFESSGIKVIIPKTDSLKPYFDGIPTTITDCLAYGWCTEMHPNGDIFLCSERYGNPDFIIGNLFQEDLLAIWKGPRRADILKRVNESKCFCLTCPHQSRGHHLNRIFQQIEENRNDGKIEDIRTWVKQLRKFTAPTIPYFL